MMKLFENSSNFDYLFGTINNYSSNDAFINIENFGEIIDSNSNHHYNLDRKKDLESLMYLNEYDSSDKSDNSDSYIIHINNYDDFINSVGYCNDGLPIGLPIELPIRLPIGLGKCVSGSLIWSRSFHFSDFDIVYKGYHYKVNYKDIEFICEKIKIDFELAIYTYLENNMDLTLTFYQFFV